MKKIKLDMFRNIDVYFTTSKEEYFKKTKFTSDSAQGLCFIDRDILLIVIGLFKDDVNTLSHEVFHAVVFINEIIGSNINGETNEFNAYLNGYLFEECYKEYKNKGIKK